MRARGSPGSYLIRVERGIQGELTDFLFYPLYTVPDLNKQLPHVSFGECMVCI